MSVIERRLRDGENATFDSNATMRTLYERGPQFDLQIRELTREFDQLDHDHAELLEKHARLDQTYADLSRQHTAFMGQQLPGLLESIADLTYKVTARTREQDNLVKSVPIALRNLMRDLTSLRESLGQQVGRLDSVLANQQLTGLTESVSYLLGRVEFVRRELMFEMRYGASTPAEGKDALATKTEIIAPARVEAARKSGIRLNLGCGHVPLDGYLNVDRRALPHVDIVSEVDELPFEAGEVEAIHSAHLLEHFPQEQLRRELLPNWFRLLQSQGTLSAVVPDAEGMIHAYTSREYDFERLREVTFGGQDYDGDFHYNMLNADSLSKLLGEAGFADVRIVATNRENGGCKEFEVRATRP